MLLFPVRGRDTESLYYYGRGICRETVLWQGRIFSVSIYSEERRIPTSRSGQKTLLCITFSRTVSGKLNSTGNRRKKRQGMRLLPDKKSDSNGKIFDRNRIRQESFSGRYTERMFVRTLTDIEKLGNDCIDLNPIFEAASYHKYDTHRLF